MGLSGRIRRPFRLDGRLWTNVGNFPDNIVKAYRLVVPSLFKGKPTTYDERLVIDGGEVARRDPMGASHGIRVKFRGKAYVLCGPPVFLTPRPEPNPNPQPHQGLLFDL